MIEIIWQYDPNSRRTKPMPATASEARRLLEEGNQKIAALAGKIAWEKKDLRHIIPFVPADIGLSDTPGEAPKQQPFAVILGCADARAPIELIFNQWANDLFVVRVAGNVLGAECLGSIDFAVAHLDRVRLIVVLGHTSCGAMAGAVDTFLVPLHYLKIAANAPMRSIVDSLSASVRGAAGTLEEVYGLNVVKMPGYRQALIELSIIINAALTATVIQQTFQKSSSDQLEVVYGVYNLHNRYVGRPDSETSTDEWQMGLFHPPADEKDFAELASHLTKSSFIRRLLMSGQPAAVVPH